MSDSSKPSPSTMMTTTNKILLAAAASLATAGAVYYFLSSSSARSKSSNNNADDEEESIFSSKKKQQQQQSTAAAAAASATSMNQKQQQQQQQEPKSNNETSSSNTKKKTFATGNAEHSESLLSPAVHPSQIKKPTVALTAPQAIRNKLLHDSKKKRAAAKEKAIAEKKKKNSASASSSNDNNNEKNTTDEQEFTDFTFLPPVNDTPNVAFFWRENLDKIETDPSVKAWIFLRDFAKNEEEQEKQQQQQEASPHSPLPLSKDNFTVEIVPDNADEAELLRRDVKFLGNEEIENKLKRLACPNLLIKYHTTTATSEEKNDDDDDASTSSTTSTTILNWRLGGNVDPDSVTFSINNKTNPPSLEIEFNKIRLTKPVAMKNKKAEKEKEGEKNDDDKTPHYVHWEIFRTVPFSQQEKDELFVSNEKLNELLRMQMLPFDITEDQLKSSSSDFKILSDEQKQRLLTSAKGQGELVAQNIVQLRQQLESVKAALEKQPADSPSRKNIEEFIDITSAFIVLFTQKIARMLRGGKEAISVLNLIRRRLLNHYRIAFVGKQNRPSNLTEIMMSVADDDFSAGEYEDYATEEEKKMSLFELQQALVDSIDQASNLQKETLDKCIHLARLMYLRRFDLSGAEFLASLYPSMKQESRCSNMMLAMAMNTDDESINKIIEEEKEIEDEEKIKRRLRHAISFSCHHYAYHAEQDAESELGLLPIVVYLYQRALVFADECSSYSSRFDSLIRLSTIWSTGETLGQNQGKQFKLKEVVEYSQNLDLGRGYLISAYSRGVLGSYAALLNSHRTGIPAHPDFEKNGKIVKCYLEGICKHCYSDDRYRGIAVALHSHINRQIKQEEKEKQKQDTGEKNTDAADDKNKQQQQNQNQNKKAEESLAEKEKREQQLIDDINKKDAEEFAQHLQKEDWNVQIVPDLALMIKYRNKKWQVSSTCQADTDNMPLLDGTDRLRRNAMLRHVDWGNTFDSLSRVSQLRASLGMITAECPNANIRMVETDGGATCLEGVMEATKQAVLDTQLANRKLLLFVEDSEELGKVITSQGWFIDSCELIEEKIYNKEIDHDDGANNNKGSISGFQRFRITHKNQTQQDEIHFYVDDSSLNNRLFIFTMHAQTELLERKEEYLKEFEDIAARCRSSECLSNRTGDIQIGNYLRAPAYTNGEFQKCVSTSSDENSPEKEQIIEPVPASITLPSYYHPVSPFTQNVSERRLLIEELPKLGLSPEKVLAVFQSYGNDNQAVTFVMSSASPVFDNINDENNNNSSATSPNRYKLEAEVASSDISKTFYLLDEKNDGETEAEKEVQLFCTSKQDRFIFNLPATFDQINRASSPLTLACILVSFSQTGAPRIHPKFSSRRSGYIVNLDPHVNGLGDMMKKNNNNKNNNNYYDAHHLGPILSSERSDEMLFAPLVKISDVHSQPSYRSVRDLAKLIVHKSAKGYHSDDDENSSSTHENTSAPANSLIIRIKCNPQGRTLEQAAAMMDKIAATTTLGEIESGLKHAEQENIAERQKEDPSSNTMTTTNYKLYGRKLISCARDPKQKVEWLSASVEMSQPITSIESFKQQGGVSKRFKDKTFSNTGVYGRTYTTVIGQETGDSSRSAIKPYRQFIVDFLYTDELFENISDEEMTNFCEKFLSAIEFVDNDMIFSRSTWKYDQLMRERLPLFVACDINNTDEMSLHAAMQIICVKLPGGEQLAQQVVHYLSVLQNLAQQQEARDRQVLNDNDNVSDDDEDDNDAEIIKKRLRIRSKEFFTAFDHFDQS